eukprot:11291052-Prorocentrum_lima.AAC.1
MRHTKGPQPTGKELVGHNLQGKNSWFNKMIQKFERKNCICPRLHRKQWRTAFNMESSILQGGFKSVPVS